MTSYTVNGNNNEESFKIKNNILIKQQSIIKREKENIRII